MYSASNSQKKYTFLINLNKLNNYKQQFYLPQPISNFSYVGLQSNQFFGISTNFTAAGYFSDLYDPNNSSRLISGLIVSSDIVKATITSNQITSLEVQLVIPEQPLDTDTFQGALVFSN